MLTVMSPGTSTFGMLASRHAEGQGRTQHIAHMSGEGIRNRTEQSMQHTWVALGCADMSAERLWLRALSGSASLSEMGI